MPDEPSALNLYTIDKRYDKLKEVGGKILITSATGLEEKLPQVESEISTYLSPEQIEKSARKGGTEIILNLEEDDDKVLPILRDLEEQGLLHTKLITEGVPGGRKEKRENRDFNAEILEKELAYDKEQLQTLRSQMTEGEQVDDEALTELITRIKKNEAELTKLFPPERPRARPTYILPQGVPTAPERIPQFIQEEPYLGERYVPENPPILYESLQLPAVIREGNTAMEAVPTFGQFGEIGIEGESKLDKLRRRLSEMQEEYKILAKAKVSDLKNYVVDEIEKSSLDLGEKKNKGYFGDIGDRLNKYLTENPRKRPVSIDERLGRLRREKRKIDQELQIQRLTEAIEAYRHPQLYQAKRRIGNEIRNSDIDSYLLGIEGASGFKNAFTNTIPEYNIRNLYASKLFGPQRRRYYYRRRPKNISIREILANA